MVVISVENLSQELTPATVEQTTVAPDIVPTEGREYVKLFGEEDGGGMHIVGMHAHAAHHSHNHPQGQDACGGTLTEPLHSHGDDGHGHRHSHGLDDVDGGVRHVVVSQVPFVENVCLELIMMQVISSLWVACCFLKTCIGCSGWC